MANLGDFFRLLLRNLDSFYISWFGRKITCGNQEFRGFYRRYEQVVLEFGVDSPEMLYADICYFTRPSGDFIVTDDGVKWYIVGGYRSDGNWSSGRWTLRCRQHIEDNVNA